MKVVVINGSGGVGKDTVCEIANRFAKTHSFSFSTPAKELAEYAGYNGETDEKTRRFLADLVDALVLYNDSPFRHLMECYQTYSNYSDTEIMFMHIRKPEDIKRAVKEFNATTLLVSTQRVEKVTSNSADGSVDDYVYDYYITNDGTLDDLTNEVEKFIEFLRAK